MPKACNVLCLRLLCIWTSIILAATGSHADTFTTTKFNDTADGACDTDCSLREAIIAANANPGLDTIQLDAGTYSLSLTGPGDTGGDLDITDTVEILGIHLSATLINGTLVDRVLDVHTPDGMPDSRIHVSVSRVTVFGGRSTSSGGGLRVRNHTTVELLESSVTDNEAVGDGAYGGGIYIGRESKLQLADSLVSKNLSNIYGGGVFVAADAELTISNSWVHENTTLNPNLSEGGGLFVEAGAVAVIDSSTFSQNRSKGPRGGGIENRGVLTIVNSTISENTATEHGGGIDNQLGRVDLVHVTLSGNTSSIGPAITSDAGTERSSGLTLSNSVIDGKCSLTGKAHSAGGNVESGFKEAAGNCGLQHHSDKSASTNLRLGSLLHHGSTGPSHHLKDRSEARGAGKSSSCLSRDQRGVSRPPSGCDSGAHQSGIVVNTTGDSVADDGQCTLREAIAAANNNAASGSLPNECVAGHGETDAIEFLVPGDGPHVIRPDTQLPTTSQPVIIDATTQPGTQCGTQTLMVEIDGGSLVSGRNGLVLEGMESTVRGLAIHGYLSEGFSDPHGNAIILAGGGSHTVSCNFLGLAADGRGAGSIGSGVRVLSPDNQIGGRLPEHRNVIANMDVFGVLASTNSQGTRIQGNYFGIDSSGLEPVRGYVNGSDQPEGIRLSSTGDRLIGGSVPGAHNLFGGVNIGIFAGASATDRVQGNWFGGDPDDEIKIPIYKRAISFSSMSFGTEIGGMTAGAGNLIVNNDVGIRVSGSNHKIVGNRIESQNTDGIHYLSGSEVEIYGNCFTRNTQLGISTEQGLPVNAGGNWWGHSTGPSGHGQGFGDSINTGVHLVPRMEDSPGWLESPPAHCSTLDSVSDLVVKIKGPNSMAHGSSEEYIVTVTNEGPDIDDGVVVSLESGFGPSPDCTGTWTLGSLDGGESKTQTCTISSQDAALSLAGAHLRARITAWNARSCPSVDSGAECVWSDLAELTIAIANEADLAIEKSVVTDSVIAGRRIAYKLVATNHGPDSVRARVEDHPEEDGLRNCTWSSLSAAGARGQSSCLDPDADCHLSEVVSMPAASSITYNLHCDVADTASVTVTNNARIEVFSFDSNHNNNSTSAEALVQRAADLSLDIREAADPITKSSTLSYTLDIHNAGPSSASDVEVTFTLPAGLPDCTTNSGCWPDIDWTCDAPRPLAGATVTCRRPSLPAGESSELRLFLTSPAEGALLTLSAEVNASELDPDQCEGPIDLGACDHGAFVRTTVVDNFIVVNSSEDVVNDSDGLCTLREAIESANNDTSSGSADGECTAGSGVDAIVFDIPGPGHHTILPYTELPAITEQAFLDGSSQSGSNCDAGLLTIEVDGRMLGAAFNNSPGLTLNAPRSTIRGLAINHFESSGIRINGSATESSVECNFVGTGIDGYASGFNRSGIINLARLTLIGGRDPGARNVLSGNVGAGEFGVGLWSSGDEVIVQGNYVGVDSSGLRALGNAGSGVYIKNAARVLVGGSSHSARNVVSGGEEHGIELIANQGEHWILGNWIGVASDGSTPLPNADKGINIHASVSDPTTYYIGGRGADSGNLIYGHRAGIKMHSNQPSTKIHARSNRLHDNDFGIYLFAPDSATSFSDNCISGNSTGIKNTSESAISANDNWWGHFTGPAGEQPGFGDSLVGAIEIPFSFLSTAPFDCKIAGLDLSLRAIEGPETLTAQVGTNQIVYILEVENSESTAASNVTVAVNAPTPHPPGVTFDPQQSAPSLGEYDGTTWTIPVLPPMSDATLEIVLSLDSETALDGSVTGFSAQVTGVDQGLLNPSDDSAAASTEIHVTADLQLALVGPEGEVEAGEALAYSAVIRNLGPTIARDLVVQLLLPPEAQYHGYTSGDDWSCGDPGGSGSVICTIDTLATSAETQIDFELRAPQALITLTTTAHVTAATRDPDPSNNTSSRHTEIVDNTPPMVQVVSPNGGEFWILSEPGQQRSEIISWTMGDNVAICGVEVVLRWGDHPSQRQTLMTERVDHDCRNQGLLISNYEYTLPDTPPAGAPGAPYEIEVVAWDRSNARVIDASDGSFLLTEPGEVATKTLVLWHSDRMNFDGAVSKEEFAAQLDRFANHAQVAGQVIDLEQSDGELKDLYDQWDDAPTDAARANRVLFGDGGVHQLIQQRMQALRGLQYLVLVGGDPVIPMSRLRDSGSFPERNYVCDPGETDPTSPNFCVCPTGTTTACVDLTPTTRVGAAIGADFYLSDDPLTAFDPVTPGDLDRDLFLPGLVAGRLVESPEEINAAIDMFLSLDGSLDLSQQERKVLVSAYDFLRDSGRLIAERWNKRLGPNSSSSASPVVSSLLSADWGLPQGTVGDRANVLWQEIHSLASDHSGRAGVISLNGHASHYQEGVPVGVGTINPQAIDGLPAACLDGPSHCDLNGNLNPGEPLPLAGAVVYAVGCHGGLPVPDLDPKLPMHHARESDHPRDLPQAYLRRGAMAYIANTGYGYGLVHGIGYSERLVQLFTEELLSGNDPSIGEAVRNAKLRYFLELGRPDRIDDKTLMQWAMFGFPMYRVSGLPSGNTQLPLNGPPPRPEELAPEETFGAVTVYRQLVDHQPEPGEGTAPPPPSLIRLNLSFDLGADAHTKRRATGQTIDDSEPCAPTPDGEEAGCYYVLNDIATGIDYASGDADLPIQPYFVYDSRLSGTSQHGVLWKGSKYGQEDQWVPVIAELITNGGDFSNHGALPRRPFTRPGGPAGVLGPSSGNCSASDLELNTIVVPTGEALASAVAGTVTGAGTAPEYDLQRLYTQVDVEALYFNDLGNGNCDRTGPEIRSVEHMVQGDELLWKIEACDTWPGSCSKDQVWRVVVVYNPLTVGNAIGEWRSVELQRSGNAWRGRISTTGIPSLSYVVQAVDRRGNVSWRLHESPNPPNSGVAFGLVEVFEVDEASCSEAGGDSDGDGVCDDVDACPGFDDGIDSDGDGIADGCDLCFGDNSTGDDDGDGICGNRDLCLGDDQFGDGDGDGICADLDCDDTNSSLAQFDGCGICGGDNSSCGIFSDPFETGDLRAWGPQSEP